MVCVDEPAFAEDRCPFQEQQPQMPSTFIAKMSVRSTMPCEQHEARRVSILARGNESA
jgi:hypothetical protein